MPLPVASLTNNLINWSASCSMGGSYDGSVALTNEDRQYDKSLRYTPFRVRLNVTAHTTGVARDANCFAGNVAWIYGIVADVEEGEGISEGTVNLKILSFPARLSRKALTTEDLAVGAGDAKSALDYIADTYGTLPAELYDFSETEALPICGAGDGQNMLEEMRKIAQAGKSTLFVQRDGILVTGAWKDSSSAVDVEIPDEAIIDAQIARDTEQIPSRITVRGCHITKRKEGKKDMADAGEPQGGGGPGAGGNPNNGKGQPQICVKNGIPQRDAEGKLENMRGSREDLRNADVTVSPGYAYEGSEDIQDGGMDVTLTSDSGYMGAGDHQIGIRVQGEESPSYEYEGGRQQDKAGQDNEKLPEQQLRALGEKLGGKPARGPAGGGGNPGGGGNKSPDKKANETEDTQIEMTVTDPDLLAEFGVVEEEIDNKYLATMEQLFDVAVRRFQEAKMRRNSYKVSCGYLACLELNNVVTFRTPKKFGADRITVTGLVTKIDVQYDANNSAVSMSLIVESFEELGSTEYVSGNLLKFPKFQGLDNGEVWGTNASTDGYGAVANYGEGKATFSAAAPGLVGIYLEQTVPSEAGAQYDMTLAGSSTSVSPDANPATPGTLTLTATDDSSATVMSTTNFTSSVSGTPSFTAEGGDMTVRIEVTALGHGMVQFVIDTLTLTKTVTK